MREELQDERENKTDPSDSRPDAASTAASEREPASSGDRDEQHTNHTPPRTRFGPDDLDQSMSARGDEDRGEMF